jgi:Tol biopolymer transport system component
LTRFTFDAAIDVDPVWTPDGRRLAFGSTRGNGKAPNIYWQRADGNGEPQRLTTSEGIQLPSSWHPSGKFLAFTESTLSGPPDVMILPFTGSEETGWTPGAATAFQSTRFREGHAAFSPDGRWIAYESAEGGLLQIYVRPFPGPGGRWQVSTTGGERVHWSRSRPELLYQGPEGQIMVAPYTVAGDTFRAERPRPWADVRFQEPSRGFDVHPDGERLAVGPIAQPEDAPRRDQVVVIFNFFAEVKRATASQ